MTDEVGASAPESVMIQTSYGHLERWPDGHLTLHVRSDLLTTTAHRELTAYVRRVAREQGLEVRLGNQTYTLTRDGKVVRGALPVDERSRLAMIVGDTLTAGGVDITDVTCEPPRARRLSWLGWFDWARLGLICVLVSLIVAAR